MKFLFTGNPVNACISGICFRDLRAVFDPGRRPWIDLSKASTAQIIDIVERCPTDALTFEWNNKAQDKNHETIEFSDPDKVKFTIMRNGPILAEGNFIIQKENGEYPRGKKHYFALPLRDVKKQTLLRWNP